MHKYLKVFLVPSDTNTTQIPYFHGLHLGAGQELSISISEIRKVGLLSMRLIVSVCLCIHGLDGEIPEPMWDKGTENL